MTDVADTRFLLVHTFPADEVERERIRDLMHRSLRGHLVIPAVVVTEYYRTAGRKLGKDGASTQINVLKENGAEISELDENMAVLAGELSLENEKTSIGDTLIAATALDIQASHIITDDPHFREFGLRTKWI